MVNISKRVCAYRGCLKRPYYGTEGSRTATLCGGHKRVGMVDVVRKLCAEQGCYKRPYYGMEGSTTATLCGEHKRVGMVDVVRKLCAYEGCRKNPSYGREGRTTGEVCSEHRKAGMVSVGVRQCGYEGCFKSPSYGREGSTTREFCSEHKKTGMVDVLHKRCAHPGCHKIPSFCRNGSKKREVCREHKKAGMVDASYKRCFHEGCSKRRSFGRVGSGQTEFCNEHKTTGIVGVSNKWFTSEGCAKLAEYGLDGSGRERLLCARPVTGGDGASSVDTTKAGGENTEVREKACGHLGLPSSRKRTITVDRFPRQVKKISTLVQESSETRSTTGFTAIPFDERSHQSRATQNLCQDDRATSRARTRSMDSGCGRKGISDLASHSGGAAPKPAQVMPTEGVIQTNTSEQEVSALVLKIASLEQQKRDAVVETMNLRDKVEQLEQKLADSAARHACAVVEAKREAEQKFTDIVQDLHAELGAASKGFKDSKGAYEAACKERRALRQQVTNTQAQLATAASKIETLANNTEKSEKSFQERIQALHADLNRTSTGWEKTRHELKKICRERHALNEEVTKTHAEVASMSSKFTADAIGSAKVKEGLEQRVQSLQEELTAASTGWEETKDELKQIRQERDALDIKLTTQLAFDADMASKAAAMSKAMKHRVESMGDGPGTAVQPQTVEMVGTIAPGSQVPASFLQPLMAGLATIASPGAIAAELAAAKAPVEAQSSDLGTPASSASQNDSGGAVIEKGKMEDNTSVCDSNHVGVGESAPSPGGFLDLSTVSIKPEG